MIKLPRNVRAAIEAGVDLIEMPYGWHYVYCGWRCMESFKTSSACAKAALDFLETTKSDKRANALRATRER